MSGTEATAADGDKEVERQAESSDATEHLKMKLAKINNELQDTMKICETYKEDKQYAEKAKGELEASKRKITELERRLADSESNCKRYRNERNNLRRDVARLIDERKDMISYEQDVQKYQRDIEMLKNKYNCDIREWKNKLSDAENRYEEIIKEQKLKAETAEQEVQKFRKELGTTNAENNIDKETVNTTATEPGEINEGSKQQGGELDQPEELLATGGIHVKRQMDTIRRNGNTGLHDIDGKLDENTDDPNVNTNNDPYSMKDFTDNDTQYSPGQEQYDDFDRDDSKKYKIKRHKVIKEYQTIESREPDEESGDNLRETNGDCNEKSEEKPDEDIKEADNTNRTSWKNEVAVDEHTNPGETKPGFNLSESYQQLYNNQWKNTFEELRQYFASDRDTVTALLEILQDIMAFCKRKAIEQIEDMYRILTFSTEQKDSNISEMITKHLKECMREVSSDAKIYLYELYPTSFRKKPNHPTDYDIKVEPFVKECFEICWLIVIRDEPLEFRPLTSDEDELDLDVYIPYRNAGQYINYVVWPSLQLSRDGSVFAKGVADASDTQESRRKEGEYFHNDASKIRSLKRHDDNTELFKQKDYDQKDGKNVTTIHDRDDPGLHTRYHSNYRHLEQEYADRDALNHRNSSNLDYTDERIIRKHVSSRRNDYSQDLEQVYTDRDVLNQRNSSNLNDSDESNLRKQVSSGRNNYSQDFEQEFTERDALKQRNSVNERKEYTIENQGYSRSRDEYRSNYEPDLGDANIESSRTSSSSRVHFSRRDETRYRSDIDTIYERRYDNSKERREFDSHSNNRRRKNEENLDSYDQHYYNPVDRLGAQPLHAFDITEETRPSYPMSIIKTKVKGTANVWKPSYGYERDPTPEEMRLYHRYIDNHDHTGARDVLGNAAYLRCLRKDHTQHFYG